MPANTLNVGVVINPLIYWEHPTGSTQQIYIHFRSLICQLPGPIEHVVFAGPKSQHHWIWPLFHHYNNATYGQAYQHYSQIPNQHLVNNYQNIHMTSAKAMDHVHPSNYPPKYVPSAGAPISTPFGLVDPGWEYRQIDRMFTYKSHPIKQLIVIDPSWCNSSNQANAQALQYAMIKANTHNGGIPMHLLV